MAGGCAGVRMGSGAHRATAEAEVSKGVAGVFLLTHRSATSSLQGLGSPLRKLLCLTAGHTHLILSVLLKKSSFDDTAGRNCLGVERRAAAVRQ